MAKLTKPGSNVIRVSAQKTASTEITPSVSGVVAAMSCLADPGKLHKVTGWYDFQTQCGILDVEDVKTNYLANAVYSYYLLNGGDFYFVLAETEGGAKATATAGTLTVTAKNVGKWGNNISVAVKENIVTIKYGKDTEVFTSVDDMANSTYVTAEGTIPSEEKAEISDDDIELVASKTGKSKSEAQKVLEETNGDLAEAIMRLS